MTVKTSRRIDEFDENSCRNDEWNSDRPKEEGRSYDGPAGMEPEGLIESNWEQVSHFHSRYDTWTP